MFGTNVASSFVLMWKIYLSSWRQDWKQHSIHVKDLGKTFHQIPIAANLVWNVVAYSMFMAWAVRKAEFSAAFEHFANRYMIVPCLVGSLAFYIYRFGIQGLIKQLTVSSFTSWLSNFCTIQGLMLVNLIQLAMSYVVGLLVECFLPRSCRGTLLFSKESHETSLRVSVYYFWGLFIVLALTLPLWQRGYQLSRGLANRTSKTSKGGNHVDSISKAEIFMELLYQTAQSSNYLFLAVPLMVIAQYQYDLQVHYTHIAMAFTEVVLFNFVVRFKFCILHQLAHRIPAMHNMVHIEHHICKTIHPTTAAAGLFEFWVGGGTVFLSYPALVSIPFMILQSLYAASNLVVHTMWPHTTLIQWHTFHHTVQADIYSLNVPTAYDKEFSKMYEEDGERFSKASRFMRNEALSDVVALLIMFGMGYLFHYGFGVGLGKLEWSSAATPTVAA